jgi:hypothetical protein
VVDVWTARLGIVQGDEVLDITRQHASGDGLVFAPSWSLLEHVITSRRRARARFVGAAIEERERLQEQARIDEEAAWQWYVPRYLDEMRDSYRRHRDAWLRTLARPRVVFACVCPSARCHRVLLAGEIFVKLGACYVGELSKGRRQATLSLWDAALRTD